MANLFNAVVGNLISFAQNGVPPEIEQYIPEYKGILDIELPTIEEFKSLPKFIQAIYVAIERIDYVMKGKFFLEWALWGLKGISDLSLVIMPLLIAYAIYQAATGDGKLNKAISYLVGYGIVQGVLQLGIYYFQFKLHL